MQKKMIILIAAGACLAGGVALYVGTLRPRPSPPVVARAEVEPAVWAVIENARQAVQASPRSAQAWGRLGMVLLAHRFPAEAVICFKEAEKSDGLDLRWPYYLGMALALTDTEAAMHHWQRAV
jgi:cytochrome c-type biogenesis protein CcmH/NrfG